MYIIQEVYKDKDDPWMGILAAAAFNFFSFQNRLKIYTLGQLIFGRDTIIQIQIKRTGNQYVSEIRQKLI